MSRLEATKTSVPEATNRSESQAAGIQVDDTKAIACYANFCRVTGTPEELIVDFGLNPQPAGPHSEPIAITQRIVTNLFTAKRLLQVLQLTIDRHEAAFGALETNVERRVRRT